MYLGIDTLTILSLFAAMLLLFAYAERADCKAKTAIIYDLNRLVSARETELDIAHQIIDDQDHVILMLSPEQSESKPPTYSDYDWPLPFNVEPADIPVHWGD